MVEYMVDGINADAAFMHSRWPNRPAGMPIDGEWAWSPAQRHLFARQVHYSVLADPPSIAHRARVKDCEARWRIGGDAGPVDVPPFLEERAAYRRAQALESDGTVYASLWTVPAVIAACEAAQVRIPRWWLAWYWGRADQPRKEAVLAALKAITGVELDPATVWAWQYASGQADFSVVYGPFDWDQP